MDIEKEAFEHRLHEVEVVKRHQRKILYSLFAVAVTSLIVAVTRL